MNKASPEVSIRPASSVWQTLTQPLMGRQWELLSWFSLWSLLGLVMQVLVGSTLPAISGLTLGLVWHFGLRSGAFISALGCGVLMLLGTMGYLLGLKSPEGEAFLNDLGWMVGGQWLIGIVAFFGVRSVLSACGRPEHDKSPPLARKRMTWLIGVYGMSVMIAGPLGLGLDGLAVALNPELPSTITVGPASFIQAALALILFAPYSLSYLSIRRFGPGRLPAPFTRVNRPLRQNIDVPSTLLLCMLAGISVLLQSLHKPQLIDALSILYIPVIALTAMRASALTTYHTLMAAALMIFFIHAATVDSIYAHTGVAAELTALLLALSLIGQMLQALCSDRRVAFARLEQQALRDAQTDLLNERGLLEAIPHFVQSADRHGGAAGCGLICAYFPTLPQLFPLIGRERIPALISDILHRLSGTGCQAIARLDSHHFVCISQGKNLQAVTALAQALASRFEGLRASLTSGSVAVPAIIAGLHLPLPTDEPSDSILLALQQNTELAASRRLPCHTSTLSTESIQRWREHTHTVELIRAAIMEGRIELFAQAIVSNRVPDRGIHCEILARLRDPERGLMMPAEFIPIAQTNRLMGTLDRAVIAKTFEWFAAHPAALRKTQLCTLNLSADSLNDDALTTYVIDTLQRCGLPAQKFGFEITEGEAILNQSLASTIVDQLRAEGFKISIDDFGTGLATFDYLKRFQVDTLKIDGAFIRNLDKNPLDQEIVLSIVRVAQRLGVKTVAEFVASPDLHRQVMRIGIDYSQGYALGMPIPIEEMIDERAIGPALTKVAVFSGNAPRS